MGHLIKDRIFVSDLTPAEVKDARDRAMWLAQRWFTPKVYESFDLGNIGSGYMTAEITSCYAQGQRRIWYYVNGGLMYTERVKVGKGARGQALAYYNWQANRERNQREQEYQTLQLVGVR